MTALDQIDRCMKCFGLTPDCPVCNGFYFAHLKKLREEAKQVFVASGKVARRVYGVEIMFKEGGESMGVGDKVWERGFYARATWYDEEARRATSLGMGATASEALEDVAAALRRNGL